MIQLIDFFLEQGYQLTFVSAASKSEFSYDFDTDRVTCIPIQLNSPSFDELLKNISPKIVVFDRFLTEEQYGWRVQEVCPEALRILDTEDLHFLRKARELAHFDQNNDWTAYLQNETALREIGSVFRCDLSLIISKAEVRILTTRFKVPADLLLHLPFLFDPISEKYMADTPAFSQRQHFIVMGNLKHKPNVDAVKFLHKEIWPRIRKQLPDAECHIYGAYGNASVNQLHSEKSGFLIRGWAKKKDQVFKNSRVCLAPLRFGAGQKGKLLDAIRFGTPSVTTGFGAEGIAEKSEWNGFVEDKANTFADKAVQLYGDEVIWYNAQKKGILILNKYFDKAGQQQLLASRIVELLNGLKPHRADNFIGQMLSHHSMRSTKYLSKWIEAKNSANNDIINQEPPTTDKQESPNGGNRS